jgi:hypothetical protein
MSEYALGLIETRGLVGIIEATDAAAKAAAVVVAAAEYTGGSLMIIRIEGELGAVQAAVEAGARAVERIGELVATHVIPNPDDGLNALIPTKRYNSKYRPDDDRPPLTLGPPRPTKPTGPAAPTVAPPRDRATKRPVANRSYSDKVQMADLERMTVAELRRLARSLSRLELKGREVSKANKTQLIDAIRRVIDMD